MQQGFSLFLTKKRLNNYRERNQYEVPWSSVENFMYFNFIGKLRSVQRKLKWAVCRLWIAKPWFMFTCKLEDKVEGTTWTIPGEYKQHCLIFNSQNSVQIISVFLCQSWNPSKTKLFSVSGTTWQIISQVSQSMKNITSLAVRNVFGWSVRGTNNYT